MAEQEVNAINHLLEVEQNAKAMTDSAKVAADKKVSAAKAQADAMFKERLENLVEQNEKEFSEKTNAALADTEAQFQEYQKKIKSSSLDVDSFNKILEKVLA